MSTVLEINNLSKSYGKIKALQDLNLTVHAGEIYGILGPNGSGKTTALGIILGILNPDRGSFSWFEGKYGEYHRRQIGSILETPNFYPYLNAPDNLKIVARIRGIEQDNFDEILDVVSLLDRKTSKFRAYSLGMKQRLAIAATMIGNPEVVIFDEPTNGLDPQGIAEVRMILKQIADSGKTVIMASHILDEVEKRWSQVAIIKYGKLSTKGPIGSILTDDNFLEINATDQLGLKRWLSNLTFVNKVIEKPNYLEVAVDKGFPLQSFNKLAFENGIELTHLVARKRRLEEEFLQITAQA